jgi:hypothetical protein
MTTTWPTVAELTEAMKTEVRDLIADGNVPETVQDFSDLHDYVDANMLGGSKLPEYPDDDDEAEEWSNTAVELLNEAQTEISRWLTSGRK